MVSSSIVVYRDVPAGFGALVQTLTSCCCKTWIVDNSPTPIHYLNSLTDKSTSLLVRSDNPGYGIGHNLAIRRASQAGYKYHLVVNPDITIPNHFVRMVTSFMDDNPDLGAMMPGVMYQNGCPQRLVRSVPSPLNLVLRRLPPQNLWRRLNRSYTLDDSHKTELFYAPIISGCCMVLRIDTLKKVGFFDPRFFMYFEDYDLSRRISAISKVAVWNGVSVYHEYRRASAFDPSHFLMHVQGMVRYFNKWGWFFDITRRRTNQRYRHLNSAESSSHFSY